MIMQKNTIKPIYIYSNVFQIYFMIPNLPWMAKESITFREAMLVSPPAGLFSMEERPALEKVKDSLLPSRLNTKSSISRYAYKVFIRVIITPIGPIQLINTIIIFTNGNQYLMLKVILYYSDAIK